MPTLAEGGTHAVYARLCWLGLGIILIGAAVLRLHGIGTASLWFDEGYSWNEASHPFTTMIALTAADVHPPLFNSILYVFIRAFGDGEAALRLPSAIMGVAAVAAIFWVASLIAGRTAGFLAAVLLCLSGFHIHFSQDARPYALLVLTATLFAGATIRALETDRRGWHGASAVAALLLLYSHAYGMLLWFSFAIALAVGAKAWRDPEPRIARRWAAGQAIAVLLFLPWAGILAWQYKQIVTHGFWIPKPGPAFMLELADNLASGGFMALALAAGTALALVPASLWLRLGLGRNRDVRAAAEGHAARHQAHFIRTLLVAWLFGPLLLGFVASVISEPILFDRYVIGSLPAWLILAAMGFCRLCQMRPTAVLALAFAGTLIGAATSLWFYTPPAHEDTRAIVQAYIARAEPGDCLFAHQPPVGYEVNYYLRDLPPCYVSAGRASDIKPWTVEGRHYWAFIGYVGPENVRAVANNLQAHGWRARPVISTPLLGLFALEPAQ